MLSAGAQPFSASGLLATTVDVPAPRSVASPPNAALAQLFNLEGSSASPDSNELADFQVKPSSEAQVA
jgi:hypothetical protein